ncbi:MAG: hypothetical protein GC156_04280 [Actinomycetales bacterium]|nr:hypothetical protein [Actinomycetales bacterium]
MSEFDETDLARIEVATRLFAAWSSGDLDAPRAYLTEDPVLWDSVGGLKEGWEAIREYFGHGLERYPDLALVPTGEFWARPDGLALQWEMSASVVDDSMGAEHVGKTWKVPGLSFLVFDGMRVSAEYDYHDKGARQRSLEP